MNASNPITAPRFSVEDEKRELDNSSPEELEEAQGDIFGTNTVEETDIVKQRGAAALAEALLMLPNEEKESYLRALQQCPELVRTESEPVRFLRATNYNPWEGASRLANYWKMREEIFGDRAFLPLDITGRGAMCPESITLLESGVSSVLPNDSKGRAVLFYDRRVFDTLPDRYRRLWGKVIMYVCSSVINESEQAQKNGIVVLTYAVAWRSHGLDRKMARQGFRMIEGSAMPWRLKAIHMIYPISRKRATTTLLPVVKQLAGKFLRLRIKSHYGSDVEILTSLESFGFEAKNLPTLFLGDLDLKTRHQSWIEYRHELEGTSS